jgi:hypothetical protein
VVQEGVKRKVDCQYVHRRVKRVEVEPQGRVLPPLCSWFGSFWTPRRSRSLVFIFASVGCPALEDGK